MKHRFVRAKQGAWFVTTTVYPNGNLGCVSNNYPDKQWRIVSDTRFDAPSYQTREEAADAEFLMVQQQVHQLAAFEQTARHILQPFPSITSMTWRVPKRATRNALATWDIRPSGASVTPPITISLVRTSIGRHIVRLSTFDQQGSPVEVDIYRRK